jgi:hypothetical protein
MHPAPTGEINVINRAFANPVGQAISGAKEKFFLVPWVGRFTLAVHYFSLTETPQTVQVRFPLPIFQTR